jgi:cobalt-precorrin 5A hydrolase/precorrin-3B C17-methyltransferase
LVEAGRIDWEARCYQSSDLTRTDERLYLVFAATNQREVNARVADDAQSVGMFCNVVDEPSEGSFHLPAVCRQAGVVIAVSTSGESPARARQVRDQINDWFVRQAEG